MTLVYAFGLFAVFGFILYGWGWAARQILKARSASWPATVASGMATVVFIGGILNLARLAHPWAIAMVALAGIVLAAIGTIKTSRECQGTRPRRTSPNSSAIGFAVGVLGFTILTQVPPRAYNFHDDYQKYFAHPVRMLETGTVFGSPLNDIGADTLGGQAFLDSFEVAFLPIRYINGVGAGFGFFLCMVFASEIGGVLATLAVIFINPQYVNISALYTGSLLIMAVIEDAGSSAALTGLLYAAMVAMKSTFLLFVVVHLAAALWARGAKWTGKAAAFGALFLAPWILLHAPHYIEMLHGGAPFVDTGVRPNESFNIFSIEALDYGSTPMNYTGLMIVAGLAGLMMARAKRTVDITAAACFTMVAAYLIMVYISGPRNAGYAQAIRYFAPFAIGIAPVAFMKISGARWLPLVAAVPVLAFAPSVRDRVEQAVHSGSVLAFWWLAADPNYLAYSNQVLYGDMRHRVEAAQAKVPAGDEVVVWINTPFYLNYARNRIADVEPGAGLITPWSKMPDAHYFIWEYGGYANMDEADYIEGKAEGPDLMRRVFAARLNMTHRMKETMARSEKLYDDGSIVVFRD